MVKVILFFLLVFAVFFFGLPVLRNLSGSEKWALTKVVGYSILCAVLTTTALTIFVLLF